ncbi:hypothetical protein IV64_GL002652 [Lactiplantibacillus xiangfangensis]|uniref:WxL domain-containing protein n=1 Tax=Lactiplantibacillus xiangfangensis TaxID=942150 RepID=A0A0R2MES1_9LACO|nr:hypothetical protein [Lactiplantibacillus xiangfangensis]KRO10956.1 hypothetical protein IV64_GL002652 [Lactiplantibacillus xiangfangensis]
MVEWKWVKWVLLSAILLVLLQCGTVVNGQAASSGIYKEDVMNDSHFKPVEKSDSSLIDGPDIKLQSYPSLDRITANYVDNGRITTKTTRVWVHMLGWAILPFGSTNKITDAQVVLMTGDGKRQPIVDIATNKFFPKSTDNEKSKDSMLFQRSPDFRLQVDFSKLSKLFPLRIGYQLKTTQDPNHWSTYYLGTFTTDGVLKVPTIDDGLGPTSTVITGTGLPGCTITSDVNNETTTVKDDGTYALDLKTPLADHLLANPEITISENNQFGDFSEASQKQLKMSKAENNPAFHIEDNLSYPEGATDAEVMDDLRKRLEIQVDDEQLKVQYGSSKQNLAAFINSQAWGTTIAIPIYAKIPGYIQSNDIIVKITKKMENVIFTNQKSNLYFPNQPLPLNNTSIWSNDVWKLSVVDSRVIDQKWWTLTAIATESTKNNDKRDLSPFLWYVDGQQQQFPLNQLVTILDSRKTTPVSDVDGSKVYEQVFKARDSGIIIKTDSRMSPGAYEATITWTLQMEAQD